MKNLIVVLVLIFAVGFTQTTKGQFFEKLKKKTEKKIKSEGEKRVNEKIDEVTMKLKKASKMLVKNQMMEQKILPSRIKNQPIKIMGLLLKNLMMMLSFQAQLNMILCLVKR
jgi:hypothetical protein